MANDIAIKLLAARLTYVQQNQSMLLQSAAGAQNEADSYTKQAGDCGTEITALQSAIKVLSG